MTELARELLTAVAGEDPVDLAADFTARYPVAVLLDLLGIPLDRVDDAMECVPGDVQPVPTGVGRAMATFADLARRRADATAAAELAAELRDRVPAEITRDQLHYLLFGLIFPGQITTDPALGFVLADVLDRRPGRIAELDDLVRETLRRHPPAPLTLWRFTTEEVELAGVRLPPRAPVLVDILGIGTDPSGGRAGPAFGAGPHYCVGAQLAALELRAVGAVVRTDFPDARLAVPRSALRQVSPGGIGGSRLVALPVVLGEDRLERRARGGPATGAG